ncbi:hypothetical protein [Oceanospirillum sediminis]|uniref:Uncharacterized protein n=1 Tax=Oceanospirillum sediminis TaxID=2760088 RepID=A0A839IVZ9_9GAMM|nr:hypothetical protein [Oceanospirillum sediminis]MBB1488804.1 hypothetical protein [Oceanospirillum sediminis]
MNDNLRLVAVFSQLAGFILIFLMRTYNVDAFWQGVVLVLMLASALTIWLVRRYRKNKTVKSKYSQS